MSNQGTGEGPDYPPAGLPHEISQRAFEGGSAVLSARLGMQQVLQAVEDVLASVGIRNSTPPQTRAHLTGLQLDWRARAVPGRGHQARY
jgi:hypothetical protein